MPLIEVTSEEQHEIALGLKLLRIRQERLGYGDPAATRELTDRIRAWPGI